MRKGLLVGLAVALLLTSAVLPLVLPWHCPVTRAAGERIGRGMTKAEVETILGGPAGDYRTRPGGPSFVLMFQNSWSMGGSIGETWTGDEVEVEVWFDGAGVESVNLSPRNNPSPDLLEFLGWRLNRLKERWLR